MKHVLSDGLGVQSWTIKKLAEQGVITPKPVCSVFANPGDEPESVMQYKVANERAFSFPLRTIQKLTLSVDALRVRVSQKTGLPYLKHTMPVFVSRENGKRGMLQRHCTMDAKIEPIRRFLRDEIVGRADYLAWRKTYKAELSEFARAKAEKRACDFAAWTTLQDNALVCLWIGISTDEFERAKDSVVPWIRNRWPLIELGWSREMCLASYDAEGQPRPPRSSCRQCPYHSDDEWIRLRDDEPAEFAKAVETDYAYRQAVAQCPRLDGVPYLHSSLKPLDQVEFVPGRRSAAEQTPCKGICGI